MLSRFTKRPFTRYAYGIPAYDRFDILPYPILVYLQLGPTVSDYYVIIERRQYYAKINEYKPYMARAYMQAWTM